MAGWQLLRSGAHRVGAEQPPPAEQVVAAVAVGLIQRAGPVGRQETACHHRFGRILAFLHTTAAAGLQGEEKVVVGAVHPLSECSGELPAVAETLRHVDIEAAQTSCPVAGEIETSLLVGVEGGHIVTVAVHHTAQIRAVARFPHINHHGIPNIHSSQPARTVGAEIENRLAVGQITHCGMSTCIPLHIHVAAHQLGFAPAFILAFGVINLVHVALSAPATGEIEHIVLRVIRHIGTVHPAGIHPPAAERPLAQLPISTYGSLHHLGEHRREIHQIEPVGLVVHHRGVQQHAVVHQHSARLTARCVDTWSDMGHLIARLSAEAPCCQYCRYKYNQSFHHKFNYLLSYRHQPET